METMAVAEHILQALDGQISQFNHRGRENQERCDRPLLLSEITVNLQGNNDFLLGHDQFRIHPSISPKQLEHIEASPLLLPPATGLTSHVDFQRVLIPTGRTK